MNHKISGLGYGLGGLDTVLVDSAFILPSFALGAVLSDSNIREACLKYLDITIYVSLAISAIFVVPALVFDPGMARAIAFASVDELGEEYVQFKFGYWDYTMCHIIALFFSVFAGLFFSQHKGLSKIFYLIFTLLIIYIVLRLSITTTFIYIIFAILAVLNHQFSKHKTLGFVFSCFVLIILYTSIDNILDFLYNMYKDTPMRDKITDFQDILEGGTGEHGTIDSRVNHQKGAIDGFSDNIILGSSYDEYGGHSSILNRLGTTGLLGFIPYILALIYQFKQWHYVIPEKSKFYYLITWIGAFILLFAKSTFGPSGYLVICVLVPCLCMNFKYHHSIWPTTQRIKI